MNYRNDFWSTPAGERLLIVLFSLGGAAGIAAVLAFLSMKGVT
jgi:hypothetical protein